MFVMRNLFIEKSDETNVLSLFSVQLLVFSLKIICYLQSYFSYTRYIKKNKTVIIICVLKFKKV